MTDRGTGSVGVFTTDRALVVRSWDAWMARATGLSESDAIGRALPELYPELESRGLLARLRRAVESDSVEILAPAFHEFLVPCATRTPTTHFARMQQHVTIAPLHAGDEVVGISVSIEDVTTRRVRERELALQLQSDDDAVRLHALRTLDTVDAGLTAPLAGALGDASWRVRRAAAEGLARGEDESARDALLAAVRDRHRDPAVLNAALTALIHTEHDVVPSLVGLFVASEDDTDARTYAILALGLLEDRRAVPTLVRALEDDDANVRFHAIEALGRVRSRVAALPLAAVAESGDFAVAFAALDALALIGEPSVAPRIVPLLDDELLQSAAADALGRLGGEASVAPLASLLSGDRSIAVPAACALAALSARLDGGRTDTGVAQLTRGLIGPDAARRLALALRNASSAEAAGIVTVLGWLESDGVNEALARALAIPSARALAADALARRGPAAVLPLVVALSSDTDDVRKAAADALGRLGATAAVAPLVARLDDDAEIVVVVAGALGSIGDQRALGPLLAQLDHPQAAVRQAVVSALNSIGHVEMQARVESLFADPSPQVREAATRIAGYAGDSRSVEQMLALCDDPDERVRRAAVEQLPHFDDRRALRAIVAALGEGSSGVRAAAARALAQVTPAEAIPRLLAACEDADPWVRYYAARSLGHQGDHAVVDTLVHLVTSDRVPPVRIAAINALAELRSAHGLEALRPLAHDPDPIVARQTLLALAQSPDGGALPVLVDAARSPDRDRVLAAFDALESVALGEGESLVEALAPLAQGADAELRARAIALLARVGGERAVAALIDAAEDPRRAEEVVEALATLGDAQVPWVARGLAHPDVAVRCVVIETLSRMRHPQVVAALASALSDDEDAVRVAATYALERVDLRAME